MPISHFIEFSVFLNLFVGLSYIFLKPERRTDRVFGVSLLVISYLQFYFLSLQNRTLIEYPNLFMSYIPAVLLLGPLLLLFFMQTSQPNFGFKKQHIAHILAPTIGLVWVILENLRPDTETEIIITKLFNNQGIHDYAPISIISGLSFVIYALYILTHHPMYLHPLKDKTLKTAFLFLTTSTVFVSILLLAVFNTSLSIPLASFGNTIVSMGCIGIFIWHYRRPKHFEEWVYQVREHQYKNSQLKGIDTSDIEDQLTELFEEQKLHLDGNLTLTQCALKVGLSTHQLSEYLNSKKQQSFTAFINTYRILEAQRLLVENPDMSSLRVGFESGFNSDATFNRNFKNITGMSPGKYRKAHT